MTARLKLRAEDAEDIGVIAACLQDALIPFGDMKFFPDEARFMLVANRFRWENLSARSGAEKYERVNCGICFDGVKAVRCRGIEQKKPGDLLEILTIVAEDDSLTLVFAGDAVIRFEIDRVHCRLEDFGESWPTQWRPQHPLED
jgi:hypothetical protein